MGRDIHAFAEVKNGSKWNKVGDHFTLDDFDKNELGKEKGDTLFGWRHSLMFNILARTPRGLPKDISEELKEIYDTFPVNTHWESYLTLRELTKIKNKELNELFYIHIEELKQLGEDTRVVFWFDN